MLCAAAHNAHFATENAALFELMHATKHRLDASRVTEASEAAFGLMRGLIERGQAQGALAAGNPDRLGIILFATIHGITAMVNSGMINPNLLDELVGTAVEQFLRGARPLA